MQTVPEWLKKKLPVGNVANETRALLAKFNLNTVCQGAECPNLGECFARRTAAFLILGPNCTRKCTFCQVTSGHPAPPDPGEPERVAQAAQELGLGYVVVTSVTRDDLPDGGANHFVTTIRSLREALSRNSTVEVLVPDFRGQAEAVDAVLAAGPQVFNHNLETIPRLYRRVRPGADYARSLAILARAVARAPGVIVKSGLMVGLGESGGEVREVLADLVRAGVQAVTIGQYLAPTPAHLKVQEYVTPEKFAQYERHARSLGLTFVASGPFIRSSYRAEELFKI